ncbi:hypothetical protein OF001_U360023 [Pseudomonas sp. OF001]|nr:hypothetical protein OF001_U360023 [Pseudomonas sp. OF001]
MLGNGQTNVPVQINMGWTGCRRPSFSSYTDRTSENIVTAFWIEQPNNSGDLRLSIDSASSLPALMGDLTIKMRGIVSIRSLGIGFTDKDFAIAI